MKLEETFPFNLIDGQIAAIRKGCLICDCSFLGSYRFNVICYNERANCF